MWIRFWWRTWMTNFDSILIPELSIDFNPCKFKTTNGGWVSMAKFKNLLTNAQLFPPDKQGFWKFTIAFSRSHRMKQSSILISIVISVTRVDLLVKAPSIVQTISSYIVDWIIIKIFRNLGINWILCCVKVRQYIQKYMRIASKKSEFSQMTNSSMVRLIVLFLWWYGWLLSIACNSDSVLQKFYIANRVHRLSL